MSTSAKILVIWNGLICVIGGVTIGAAIVRVMIHPLNVDVAEAIGKGTFAFAILVAPIVVLALLNYLARTNVWLLLGLTAFVCVTTLILTYTTIIHANLEISSMESRASGRRLMMCGPLIFVVTLPIGYITAFIAFAICGIYSALRAGTASPATIDRNPFFASTESPEPPKFDGSHPTT